MATIYRETVTQTLTFKETVKHNQHFIVITDTLIFTEPGNGDDYVLHYTVSNRLFFTQTVLWSLSTHRTIAQTLEFRDNAHRVHDASVYQNFSFSESTDGTTRWPLIEQDFEFDETVVGEVSKVGFNRLTFVQTVHYSCDRNLAVKQTLAFTQYAVVYREDVRYISPQPSSRLL